MVGTIQGVGSRGTAWGDLDAGKHGIGNALNLVTVCSGALIGSHRPHAKSLTWGAPGTTIVADNKRDKNPAPLKHPAVRMAQASNANLIIFFGTSGDDPRLWCKRSAPAALRMSVQGIYGDIFRILTAPHGRVKYGS
jgi:hypothetical protein